MPIDPIHIISLGAGVQSSTMALMAAHGEITPMPVAAIFADTQDESQSVYTWLDWLERQLPFPVHRVTNGKLSTEALRVKISKTGNRYTPVSIPSYVQNPDNSHGIQRRDCTQDFKIGVIQKEIRKIAGKNGNVIQWIGVSLDESHRMKPSRKDYIFNRWPLVDLRLRRSDCLRWMEKNAYPKPPRSACVYCPYHSDGEWRKLRDEQPEEFRKAVEFEKAYQSTWKSLASNKGSNWFLHNSRVPLDQVDFSTDEDHGQQVMFGNECEGMCGV